jgi:hypothetical protein
MVGELFSALAVEVPVRLVKAVDGILSFRPFPGVAGSTGFQPVAVA